MLVDFIFLYSTEVGFTAFTFAHLAISNSIFKLKQQNLYHFFLFQDGDKASLRSVAYVPKISLNFHTSDNGDM